MSLSRNWQKTLWLLVAGVIIACDQTIKYIISEQLTLHHSWVITDFFNLTYTQNRGIAFSMLSHSPAVMHFLVTVVAILMTTFLVVWFWRMPLSEKKPQLALVMIIGGAIGNLLDRLILGHVRDYLHFHIMDWHFAIFNFADAAISVGVVLMIIDILFFHRTADSKDNPTESESKS